MYLPAHFNVGACTVYKFLFVLLVLFQYEIKQKETNINYKYGCTEKPLPFISTINAKAVENKKREKKNSMNYC